MSPEDADAPQAGDFDAWVQTNYAALVASFGWVRAKNLDPSEVVHEALLVVNQRLHANGIRSRSSLFNYTRAVATNLVRTEFGPRGPAYRRRETLAAIPASTLAAVSEPPLPEEEVVQSDALSRVFATLTLAQRRALLLAAEGYEAKDIAELLGLPSDRAAIQLLYRARLAARAGFAEDARCSDGSPLPLVIAAHYAARRFNDLPVAATALVEPAASCVALAAVLSVVVALGAPTPAPAAVVVVPGTIGSSLSAAAGRPSTGTAARQRPSVPADPVAVTAVTATDAGTGAGGTSPVQARVSRCTAVACVAARPGPSWVGDRYTIVPLGDDSPAVDQWVTATCEQFPAQPVVACEEGKDPDGYAVKEVPPAPAPAEADPGGTSG